MASGKIRLRKTATTATRSCLLTRHDALKAAALCLYGGKVGTLQTALAHLHGLAGQDFQLGGDVGIQQLAGG